MGTNDFQLSWKGCYGAKVGYLDLDDFLEESFSLNAEAEGNHHEKFCTCVWGHSGVGKSAKIDQFRHVPVEWQGQKYNGYDVRHVPLAQFEEMGDLHGLPSKHVLVRKGETKRWVPSEVARGYTNTGWTIDHEAGIRTMYAPPDWVPTEPGPSVVHLEDWNRASGRIIKGIMQLMQTYGMMSWKLPPGCNLVLTANPDEQDYLVTTIDKAILTRIRSATLKHNAKEWAVWADAAGLDPRGISFVLAYPEMMIGSERTNPRTLAEFFRYTGRIPDLAEKARLGRFKRMGYALLDDQSVSSIVTFFERDVELVIEPDWILEDRPLPNGKSILDHVKDLMTRKEKRIDVMAVTIDRLYARVVNPECEQNEERIEAFQKFLTSPYVADDMRHAVCLRLFRVRDGGRSVRWLMGNDDLKQLIMDVS
jgi:hypothetical protein